MAGVGEEAGTAWALGTEHALVLLLWSNQTNQIEHPAEGQCCSPCLVLRPGRRVTPS